MLENLNRDLIREDLPMAVSIWKNISHHIPFGNHRLHNKEVPLHASHSDQNPKHDSTSAGEDAEK